MGLGVHAAGEYQRGREREQTSRCLAKGLHTTFLGSGCPVAIGGPSGLQERSASSSTVVWTLDVCLDAGVSIETSWSAGLPCAPRRIRLHWP